MRQRGEDDQFSRLGTMLGTNWTRNQTQAMFAAPKGPAGPGRDSVIIPLALTMQPELQTMLRELFGANTSSYRPQWANDKASGEVIEAADLSREQFLQLAGQASVGAAVQQMRIKRGESPQ
jgi:hypothetical protein